MRRLNVHDHFVEAFTQSAPLLRIGKTSAWMFPFLSITQKVWSVFVFARCLSGLPRPSAQANFAEATRRYLKAQKLRIKRKSHPIRILIEASAGREDARQKSRWTQALRNMYGWKLKAERMDWFLGNNGGISGAASKEAKKRAGKRNSTHVPSIVAPSISVNTSLHDASSEF